MKTDIVNIKKLMVGRRDQTSFHTFSEKGLRVEFFNMKKSEILEETKYGGEVLLTVYEGKINLVLEGEEEEMGLLDQTVIPRNQLFSIRAQESPSFIQFVWAPPFEKIETKYSQKGIKS